MKTQLALTTGEAAKYCQVNLRTVIRWIDRGYLKAYKLPGRGDNRIIVEDFLEFLRQNNIPVPEEFKTQSQKILIIDDEVFVTNGLQRSLCKWGYEVLSAHSGFEAGALLESLDPDLITLDLKMPGINGYDILRSIHTKKNVNRPPKVLILSGAPKSELKKALDLGADDYLEKPFIEKDLIDKIKTLITT